MQRMQQTKSCYMGTQVVNLLFITAVVFIISGCGNNSDTVKYKYDKIDSAHKLVLQR